MCRLLAYAGPPLPLDKLIAAPEHSLVVQSYQPREMTSGVVNADGHGFAWYDPARRAQPFVYRSTLPIWNDVNFADLAAYATSGQVLAYVRSATPGQALDLSNTQPFVAGELSFIHNGFITGFRPAGGGGLHRRLRAQLDDDIYAMIHGNTDSEHLFAWLVQHIRATGSLRAGVEAGLAALEAIAGDTVMSLNFALGDGETIVAGRHALGTTPPSLYSLTGHGRFPGATLVTSEPLFDDPSWTACPPNSLTILSRAAADRPAVHALAA